MHKMHRRIPLIAVLLLFLAVGCEQGIAEDLIPHDTLEQDTITFYVPYGEEEGETGPLVSEVIPDTVPLVQEHKTQNPDTVGWLYIPGTDINQVVVQNPVYETNNYYLNLSFDGLPDKNGTYCVDRRAAIGEGNRWELSRITPVYGHSWDDDPNGELFAQLKKYRDPDFAREHPYIFFSTGSENMAWEVFAVFESGTDLSYNVPQMADGRFYDVLDLIERASLYNYPVTVGPDDKVLTLSTCIFSVQGHDALPERNSYRFAVMARLVEEDAPLKQQAELAVNAAPLAPDEITRLLDSGAMRVYAHGSSSGEAML